MFVMHLFQTGVKIKGVQGRTVHRCPTLRPPFWPPLVLKITCPFYEKIPLLSKKVPFCTEKLQLNMRKVLFYCKKCPFAWKKSLLLEKKYPFTLKKCPFERKNVPLCIEKVPFCSKNAPFFDLSTVAQISYFHPWFQRKIR